MNLFDPQTATVGERTFIDFKNGRLASTPREILAEAEKQRDGKLVWDWARREKLDAQAQLLRDSGGITGVEFYGVDLTARQIPNAVWDGTNPWDISTELGKWSADEVPHSSIKAESFPTSFVFKTREGSLGVLQILNFNDNSSEVTIRYKLFPGVPPTTQKAATEPLHIGKAGRLEPQADAEPPQNSPAMFAPATQPTSTQPATSDPPQRLEFLKGVYLKMPEREFQDMVKSRGLTVQITQDDDGGTSYHVSTESGERNVVVNFDVVVMFDKDGACRGIQRLQPTPATAPASSPATKPAAAKPATLLAPTQPAVVATAWRAKLPCGATVELVAVTEDSASNKPFWRPDGSLLARPPEHFPDRAKLLALGRPGNDFVILVSGLSFDRQQGDYEVLTDIQPAAGPGTGVFSINSATWTDSIFPPIESPDGPKYSDIYVLSQSFPKPADRASIQFGLAAGPWETIASDPIDGRGDEALSRQGIGGTNLDVSFGVPYTASFPNYKPLTVHITVAHNVASGHQVRVIAILADGSESVGDVQVANGHVQQMAMAFRRGPGAREQDMVAIKDIKEFRLQSRPFQWAEFRDIALSPQAASGAATESSHRSPPTTAPATQPAEPLQSTQRADAQPQSDRSATPVPAAPAVTLPATVPPSVADDPSLVRQGRGTQSGAATSTTQPATTEPVPKVSGPNQPPVTLPAGNHPATQAAIEAARTITYRRYEPEPGHADQAIKMMIKDGRLRMENPDGTVVIKNAIERNSLFLDPADKEVTISTLVNVHPDDPVFTVANIEKIAEPGRYAVVNLGKRQIGGTDADGIRFNIGGEQRTVWRNPATHRPIQIEIELASNPATGKPLHIIYRDIEFDTALDDQLFSIVPPPGYKVMGRVLEEFHSEGLPKAVNGENFLVTKDQIARIETQIKTVPVTTSYLADLFELTPGSKGEYRWRTGVVSHPLLPAETSSVDFLPVHEVPAGKLFYIQWDGLGASTLHYYGPFHGDPAAMLADLKTPGKLSRNA